MSRTELTNMIMIRDAATGKLLVQNRIKNWCGFSFPGGHVEDGESFVDSAIREAKEETGLDVRNLKGCGVIHWSNKLTHDRYLSFLYTTTDFEGELLDKSNEGENVWMSVDEIFAAKSTNGMHEILRMFMCEEYSEAFGSWSNDDNWSIDEFK